MNLIKSNGFGLEFDLRQAITAAQSQAVRDMPKITKDRSRKAEAIVKVL